MMLTGLFFRGLLDFKFWLEDIKLLGWGNKSFLDLPPKPSYCRFEDLKNIHIIIIQHDPKLLLILSKDICRHKKYQTENIVELSISIFTLTSPQQQASYYYDLELASMETSLHHQDYETSSLNQIPQVYKKEVCSLKINFNQFLNDQHYVDQSQSLVECCHCHYHVITCFRISKVALFGCILNYQMNILRYFS